MTTNVMWEILRWKTEGARINKMGPETRICFSVVGLSFDLYFMKLVTLLTSVILRIAGKAAAREIYMF